MTGQFEILDSRATELGTITLRRRELLARPGTEVTEVTLEQELLMSSLHTTSERALAELALAEHPGRELRVVVGGLGLGFTARAVLESARVRSVVVVELLQPVIDWLHAGLLPTSRLLLDDARCTVVPGDIFARLAQPPERAVDAILIDVDHSPRETLHAGPPTFYGVEEVARAREHLAPGGVLAVWSTARDPDFEANLARAFERVRCAPVPWFNEILEVRQEDVIFIARRER